MRLKVARSGKELRPNTVVSFLSPAPRAARRGLRRRHHRHSQPRRAAARRHAHRRRGAAVHRPAVLRARDVPHRSRSPTRCAPSSCAPASRSSARKARSRCSARSRARVLLLGAVGQLQFEVVAHRLEHEYGCKARIMPARYNVARWVTCDEADGGRRSCSASSTATPTASPTTRSTRPRVLLEYAGELRRDARELAEDQASTRCASTRGWCSRSSSRAEPRQAASAAWRSSDLAAVAALLCRGLCRCCQPRLWIRRACRGRCWWPLFQPGCSCS